MIFVLGNMKMSYLLSFSFWAFCYNRYPLNNELESFLFYFRNQQCYFTWKNNRRMYFFHYIKITHFHLTSTYHDTFFCGGLGGAANQQSLWSFNFSVAMVQVCPKYVGWKLEFFSFSFIEVIVKIPMYSF